MTLTRSGVNWSAGVRAGVETGRAGRTSEARKEWADGDSRRALRVLCCARGGRGGMLRRRRTRGALAIPPVRRDAVSSPTTRRVIQYSRSRRSFSACGFTHSLAVYRLVDW